MFISILLKMKLKIILRIFLLVTIKNVVCESESTTVGKIEAVSANVPSTSENPEKSTKKSDANANTSESTSKNPNIECVDENCTIEFLKSSEDEVFKFKDDKVPEHFTKGKTLKIKSSTISKVPSEIGKIFPNLEKLDVSGVGLETISKKEMEKFPKLKILIAADNKIECIKKDVFEGNSKIQEIDLSNNKIKTIKTKSIRNSKDLKMINLTGNKCISEKFENVDGDERERQKNMNKIMIKCKEKKKEKYEEPSSLVMSIKKSVESLNPLKLK
jgi:Leucine-rich repeat (LRR) protein